MSKRVVLISRNAQDAKSLTIEGVTEELSVTWDHAVKYLSGYDEYEKLNPDALLKVVRMFNADYIALDIPMYSEQLEKLLYAIEKTDAKLLEKEGERYIQVAITA